MTKERLKQSLKNYQSICAELEGLIEQLSHYRMGQGENTVCTERVHLEQQIRKLQEDCAGILEEVSKIEDIIVRQIIQYRYLQPVTMNWTEISRRMGYYSESTARMILSRYFEPK